MLTANVIGATGLVGRQLVKLLIDNENFDKIRIFARRDTGFIHPKTEQVIVDFSKPNQWENLILGDVLFSTLGTTLKQAGSKEKQFEIDYTFNLNFAETAKKNGIQFYVLVSSVGANSKSRVFYTRMKGELDDAVAKLGFQNLVILRPSYLAGKREKTRFIEAASFPMIRFLTRFFFKKYRPIEDSIVARAMINSVINPVKNKTIWEADEVFLLAK